MKIAKPRSLYTSSPEETEAFGFFCGRHLGPRQVIALFGDLGAGKTTFVKGLIRGAIDIDPEHVTSPTFNYLNIYSNQLLSFYHFDLFRLSGPEAFMAAGLNEYLEKGVCCFEWSEKIETILPTQSVRITLKHEGNDRRSIWISS